jgi:hypothetical protein
MKNKFKLQLPENGFGFPSNICENHNQPVEKCRDCTGYGGPFDADISDIRRLMESHEAKAEGREEGRC